MKPIKKYEKKGQKVTEINSKN